MSSQRRLLRPGRMSRIATITGLATTLVCGALTSTEAAAATTNLRTAIVVLNYPDANYGLSPERRTFLENIHYGTTPKGLPGLAPYIEEASDGRVTFVPMPGRATVLGPYEINAERTCDAFKIRTHAIDALAAHGILKTDYDALSVHHQRLWTCGWGGVGWTQDGIKTTIYGQIGEDGTVLRHEFGHTFSLNHLGSTTCSGTLANCSPGGYRGSTPMGGQGDSGYAAPELVKRKWFRPAQLVVGPAPGIYTLTPLHAPRDATGTRILEIPRDHGTWNRLFIAYRAKGTIDPGTDGVQLHLSRSTPQYFHGTFQLIDPSPGMPGADKDLAVGQSITDPASGLTITTVSRNADSAVVQLS